MILQLNLVVYKKIFTGTKSHDHTKKNTVDQETHLAEI